MQSNQQFEQLILQYNQLKNSAEEIRRMIEKEDFDSAITLRKNREPVFLNCKCIRKFLELNETQEKELNIILDELRELEINNIKYLETSMKDVQQELRKTQTMEKIQQAYDFDESQSGSIINYSD